ncbi:seven-hairpin glycosidase [Coprinellus micaceus]|uniref:alpha-1,2-Mannosidase n=1 Tax=Coprinellus micaceus TaxID=71717 RepID=A0A4Y7THF2_COPMI|nr:seven-hairpin glycosidase [Coprinellus micaceus]
MKLLRILPVPFLLLSTAYGGLVQSVNPQVPLEYALVKAEVVEMFEHGYQQYKNYAWGYDNLAPLTRTYNQGRNGWGATIVDAMGTMSIMAGESIVLDSWLKEAINYTAHIDFSQSKQENERVSIFETTIRYLGGMLSTYELTNEEYPELLGQSVKLADKLAYGWVGSNNIPYGWLNFTNNEPQVTVTNIAEAGTLTLEWEVLSKFTGNKTYEDLVLRSVNQIAKLEMPLPGLAPVWIDPTTSSFSGGYITWGGGGDSYFEYLIKHARLSNTDDSIYADSWATAIDSSITHLLKTSTVGNHTYLADYDSDGLIRHTSSHLACFHGGNFLLGGKLLDNQTIVDVGLALVDGCWNTYASTATGIGPESFGFISEDGSFTGPGDVISDEQLEFYNKTGFYPRSTPYVHRPEVLESNFYAWRVTGDTKYLDRAKSAVHSLNTYIRVPSGFAGLWNVNQPGGGLIDDTESFWFAETLKYLYLTFDDPTRFSLDEYVFTTEAQLFKAPPPKEKYGSGTLRKPTGTFRLTEGPAGPAYSDSPGARMAHLDHRIRD